MKNYLIVLFLGFEGNRFFCVVPFQILCGFLKPENPTKKIVDPPGVYTLSGVDEKKVSIFVKIKNETLIIKGFCFKNLMGPNLTIVECKGSSHHFFSQTVKRPNLTIVECKELWTGLERKNVPCPNLTIVECKVISIQGSTGLVLS